MAKVVLVVNVDSSRSSKLKHSAKSNDNSFRAAEVICPSNPRLPTRAVITDDGFRSRMIELERRKPVLQNSPRPCLGNVRVHSKWSKPDIPGLKPPPRSAASLVAVGTNLYLFGGLSHMCGWFDDVHVYDTEKRSWAIVETEGIKPRARDKLQAVAFDNSIYYFGGFGPKSDEAEVDDLASDDEDDEDIPESRDQQGAEFGWFNDLYILDTANRKWSQPMQMNLGVPTQRAAHGMCAIGRNLVIFGGRDSEDRQNDIHIFNIDTRKWMLDFKVEGVAPEPRSFHTLTSVGGRAVVCGGRGRDNKHFSNFVIFDLEHKEWIPVTSEGYQPPGRGQHSCVTVGDKLLVMCGSGEFSPEIMQCKSFYTDVFEVPIGDFSGEKKQSNGVH